MTDDLDGSPDAETVLFGFAGVSYEIDLGQKNRAKLEKVLDPYIKAGRRMPRGGGGSGRRRGAERSGGSVDRAAVRAWAKSVGIDVSERGRISTEIMRQYDEAH
jgi:hypothetical protein